MLSKEKIKNILSIDLVRDSLKLSSSNILLFFLPLLVTPILSRIYTPESYGDWGIFSSTLIIISPILFLSYEWTIVRSQSDKDIPNLCVLCLLISLSILGFIGIVFYAGIFFNNTFFVGFPSPELFLWSLLIQIFSTIATNIANREKLYSTIAISNVIKGISQIIFRIIFGTLILIQTGLILGNFLSILLSTIYFLFIFRRKIGNSFFKTVKFREIKRLFILNKKFPLYDMPARLLEFSTGHLSLIILSLYFSKSDIGCYSMVTQFILLPITFIGSAISQVYYRQVSEVVDSTEMVSKITMRVAKITLMISILPMLFLSLGGDNIFEWFIGNEWKNIGNMALCLSLFSVPVILSEPLLPLYRATNTQDVRLKLGILIFTTSIGGLLIACLYCKNLYCVLLIYSIIFSVTRFIIYFDILSKAHLKFSNINKYAYFMIIGSYVIVAVRIYLIFN